MYKRRYSSFLVFILFLLLHAKVSDAQTFGFGCLGFVGGFGGYSYLQYKADGLNNYVSFFNNENKDSLVSPLGKFKTAQGYIVGINFFRAKFPHLVITSKGFYQSLAEIQNATLSSTMGVNASESLELKLNSWGLGFDVGTKLFDGLNWKIIDASLMYNQAVFTRTENLPGDYTNVETFKSDSKIGYSLASGFILEIIEEYITLEGSAGYMFFSVDKVHKDDGTVLSEKPNQPVTQFARAGGFNAIIKLNVGFPL